MTKPPKSLAHRMLRPRDWPTPRADPNCALCGDAGWFVAVLRRAPRAEFTFACSCDAGDGAPVAAPRWKGDARYVVIGARTSPPPLERWGADRAAGPDAD